MLVSPSGEPYGGDDLAAAIEEDVDVAAACEAFLDSSRDPVPATQRSLCVLQGEQACVSFQHADIVIGSMDATTCMLMALRCLVTQRAFIAHHDNMTCCSPPSQLLACLQSFSKPELYLVGSYTEDSGISLATYHTLLTALHYHTRQPITLRLACFGPANTDARGAPRTRDVALACQSGLARPAPFVDRGPQLPRRFATASPRARSVAAHSHPGYMLLPRANIQLTSWAVMAEERLLQLDDDELVRAVSTSPLHEPSHFAADIRAAHRWKLSIANQDLEAACFTWQGAGRDEEAGTAWAPCTPPEGLQESISSFDCVRDVELAFVG